MADLLSVIIPTFNPDINRLSQTILGLQNQTLTFNHWELIIVDNNSCPAVNIDLSWHPNHAIVTATQQGLSFARLKGFDQAAGNIIVMVDDDNILDENYLKNVLEIFKLNIETGAIGGKLIPLFEKPAPVWLNEFYTNLALRDLGDEIITTAWRNEYPSFAPVGAGMAIRKTALEAYINASQTQSNMIADRTGSSLTSGGDNDIIIEVLKSGWQVGYFPLLTLQHIIPAGRMQVNYVAKLLNNTNRSWIQVLKKHNINPWDNISPWTLPLRKTKAWFTYKAWKNTVNYIKWQGACGMFDGLAE